MKVLKFLIPTFIVVVGLSIVSGAIFEDTIASGRDISENIRVVPDTVYTSRDSDVYEEAKNAVKRREKFESKN